MIRSESETKRVFVVEDEQAISDVIVYNLRRAGFDVECSDDGRAGLEQITASEPDLVVLDVMLPGLSGIEVCQALRGDSRTRNTPVIMLTAKDAEDDIVTGLESGADDYMTKPFSPRELIARVNAALRRTPIERGEDARIEAFGVSVDPLHHTVFAGGEAVELTRTELRLLHVLMQRPGRVYERAQLVRKVMGDNAWVTDRTIDVHIRSIRRKLGEYGRVIETVRGIGYRSKSQEK